MNPGSPPLTALQANLIDWLHRHETPEALPGWIKAKPGVSGGDSLAIYRQSLQSTLINALRLSYPTVECLVGPDFFTAATFAFTRLTPSTNGDLDHYGAGYGDFLDHLPAARSLPWLGDLARLEWQIHHLHREPDESRLTPDTLATADMDEFADRSLQLARRAALFSSEWPVGSLWLAHQQRGPDPELSGIEFRAERFLISVLGPTRIFFLDAASWSLLNALLQGRSMAAAVGTALAIDSRFDLSSFLASAMMLGAFSAEHGLVACPGETSNPNFLQQE